MYSRIVREYPKDPLAPRAAFWLIHVYFSMGMKLRRNAKHGFLRSVIPIPNTRSMRFSVWRLIMRTPVRHRVPKRLLTS